MNANQLADQLDGIGGYGAAEMLRRQHEAIKQLREALTNIERRSSLDSYANVLAKKALADTELVAPRQHITDGSVCWCNPTLTYKDPDTGAEVWVHQEPQ